MLIFVKYHTNKAISTCRACSSTGARIDEKQGKKNPNSESPHLNSFCSEMSSDLVIPNLESAEFIHKSKVEIRLWNGAL